MVKRTNRNKKHIGKYFLWERLSILLATLFIFFAFLWPKSQQQGSICFNAHQSQVKTDNKQRIKNQC
ncbi:hypothetical protein DQD36_20410 [Salmonella enterica subsp. enterica serovar Chester]|nr:hypothetical protein [Salmonella enterica subsp. enterica serovar Chester]EBW7376648.1 hypothetical protein [Salmonella enterica subsp. enterica serovar Chester]